MKADRFDRLMAFLERLENAKIPFRITKHIEDAISVEAYAPGEHWEVDFWVDGDVYVERFRSNGHIDDESVFGELFALCADDEPSASPAVDQGDSRARK